MSATIKIRDSHSRMALVVAFVDKLKLTMSTSWQRSTCSLSAPPGYPEVPRQTLNDIHAAFEKRLQAGPTYGDAIRALATELAGVTSINDLAERISTSKS